MSESSKVNYSKVLIKGSLALSMAEMSVKVIGFLLLPIFTYYLSPKDFGIISIVFLITSTLNLLYNPGIISAVQRLYHSDNDLTSRQELIGSSYVFFISTPIIVLLTSIIFGDFIFSNIFDDFKFYPYGIAAVILSFFVQTKRLWVTLLTLTYEVKKIAIYTVISVFIGILVSLFLVVYLELGVMGRVLGAFPGSILLFIIGSREIIKFSKFRWSIVKLKYISLVNIIMNKQVVEELIQNNCNSKNIASSLKNILSKKKSDQIKNEYKKLYQILDKGGASKITSNLILERITK